MQSLVWAPNMDVPNELERHADDFASYSSYSTSVVLRSIMLTVKGHGHDGKSITRMITLGDIRCG